MLSRLLKVNCDSVVQIDSTFQVQMPAPELAAILQCSHIHGNLVGVNFLDLMTAEDSERLKQHLSEEIRCQMTGEHLYPLHIGLFDNRSRTSVVQFRSCCSYLQGCEGSGSYLVGLTVTEEQVIPPADDTSNLCMSAQIGLHATLDNKDAASSSADSRASNSCTELGHDLFVCFDGHLDVDASSSGFDEFVGGCLQGQSLKDLFVVADDSAAFESACQLQMNGVYYGDQSAGKSLLLGPSLLKLKSRLSSRKSAQRYYNVTWHVWFKDPDTCWAKLTDVRRFKFRGRGTPLQQQALAPAVATWHESLPEFSAAFHKFMHDEAALDIATGSGNLPANVTPIPFGKAHHHHVPL